jgi:5-formyltetrahydrofolate cyclo-ligase
VGIMQTRDPVSMIFTPTRTLEIGDAQKPTSGILWDRLGTQMLETIPPLQELRALELA